MNSHVKNLDLLAAKTAQEIIKETSAHEVGEVDNLITKALGVLQENGVYAAMLYLYSRTSTDKEIAEKSRPKLVALTEKLGLKPSKQYDATTVLKFLTDDVCSDLERLLLVKQVWEQTLIYARYGAKARSAAEGKK
jgi:hypothetical protein